MKGYQGHFEFRVPETLQHAIVEICFDPAPS